VLRLLSFLSSLLPIISFLFFATGKAKKDFWVIFVYCVISLGFDLILTPKWGAEYRFFIWNVYTIVQYILLVDFFYLIIKTRKVRIFIVIFSIFYFLIFFYYSKSDIDQFNSLMSTIESVILLILSLYYLLNSLKLTVEPHNIFTPHFFIIMGVLLYIASTFFLFIIANQLSVNEMNKYWSINHYSNILTNLVFSFAFYLFRYQKKSSPAENNYVDFTFPDKR
jgi:hypothetical protein